MVITSQIMNILKREHEILDDFENNVPSSRKRQRHVTRNENINKIMLGLVSEFCLLNIFIYLFVCFIQIVSY